MQRPGASLDGIWPRAAALLARQALEAAMAELWAAHRQTAGLPAATLRSQELCLTAYLDPAAASRITYLLAALSHACHYHPYELAPIAAELTSWLDQAAPRYPAPRSQHGARPTQSLKILMPNGAWCQPCPYSPRPRPERPGPGSLD
jgi:hypothetical protein